MIDRARSGDQSAWSILNHRYADHISSLIRRKYLTRDDPMRRDVDSTDLEQLTWLGIFRGLRRGHKVATEADFLKFLAVVLKNAYGTERRKRVESAKRSLDREEGTAAARPTELAAHEPGPPEAAMAVDQIQNWLQKLRPEQRPLLLALLDGRGNHEIAELLGVCERTAQRQILQMRQNLRHLNESPTGNWVICGK